jgi:hypothetical protein
MASPATVSPKFLSDLYGAAQISHSPVLASIHPGGRLIEMGSIMVYNDPAATPPDFRLRIIQDVAEIPNIYGILLETIDSGPIGATELASNVLNSARLNMGINRSKDFAVTRQPILFDWGSQTSKPG